MDEEPQEVKGVEACHESNIVVSMGSQLLLVLEH